VRQSGTTVEAVQKECVELMTLSESIYNFRLFLPTLKILLRRDKRKKLLKLVRLVNLVDIRTLRNSNAVKMGWFWFKYYHFYIINKSNVTKIPFCCKIAKLYLNGS